MTTSNLLLNTHAGSAPFSVGNEILLEVCESPFVEQFVSADPNDKKLIIAKLQWAEAPSAKTELMNGRYLCN